MLPKDLVAIIDDFLSENWRKKFEETLSLIESCRICENCGKRKMLINLNDRYCSNECDHQARYDSW